MTALLAALIALAIVDILFAFAAAIWLVNAKPTAADYDAEYGPRPPAERDQAGAIDFGRDVAPPELRR